MTVPKEFERATSDFYDFLSDARDEAGLVTTHQAYTMVEGVLLAFRCRLAPKDVVRFANQLPPLLRAFFLADWDIEAPVHPFEDRATMTKEVQNLRAEHNFAPKTAIADVARALRKHLDEAALDRLLSELPEPAREFWRA